MIAHPSSFRNWRRGNQDDVLGALFSDMIYQLHKVRRKFVDWHILLCAADSHTHRQSSIQL